MNFSISDFNTNRRHGTEAQNVTRMQVMDAETEDHHTFDADHQKNDTLSSCGVVDLTDSELTEADGCSANKFEPPTVEETNSASVLHPPTKRGDMADLTFTPDQHFHAGKNTIDEDLTCDDRAAHFLNKNALSPIGRGFGFHTNTGWGDVNKGWRRGTGMGRLEMGGNECKIMVKNIPFKVGASTNVYNMTLVLNSGIVLCTCHSVECDRDLS